MATLFANKWTIYNESEIRIIDDTTVTEVVSEKSIYSGSNASRVEMTVTLRDAFGEKNLAGGLRSLISKSKTSTYDH